MYRHLLRRKTNKENIARLKNQEFSIISQNCVGGVILHELEQRFDSPTVNLFFSAKDYLKFISELDYYLGLELRQIETKYPYPVALLGDVTIHFMHYKSFEEAKSKWVERKKRIHFDNLYFIMVQGKDCTDQMIKQFDLLPYENKVIFTARDYPEFKSAVHLKGTELANGSVTDLCQYRSKFTGKRLIDSFDYVGFLNSKKSKNSTLI